MLFADNGARCARQRLPRLVTVSLLDEKNAASDTRNKALFTLQSIRKKINAATSLKSIAGYQVEAIDEFEYTMDLLE